MESIPYTTLHNTCHNIVASNNFLHKGSRWYFRDLLYTGCRSSEPLDIKRWTIKNERLYLITEKTAEIREFDMLPFTENFIECVKLQVPPYFGLTYDQLVLEQRRVQMPYPIKIDKKIVDAYLFRYYVAKTLFYEEQSLLDIMQFMGWNDSRTAFRYIHADLKVHKGI
jgi:hypothetical protein